MCKSKRGIAIILFCLLNVSFGVSCSNKSDTLLKANTLKGEIKSIDTSFFHSMVVMEDGSLWAWGDNSHGQLGDGTTKSRLSPTKIMDDVLMVSTGEFTMAVKNDGTLWGWGDNSRGQLGDGTNEARHSPVKIMDDVVYVSVDGYSSHTAIIKTDGSLWVWGEQLAGGMGDGTTFNQYYPETPTKVMENVVHASSGGFVVMAILEDGTLWGWGTNANGALGNGTAAGSISPVLIMENVTFVKANTEFTAAITTDGALWTWGFNQYGMLGNGESTDCYSPIKILEDVVYVNGANAITADGALWAWHRYESFDGDGDYTIKELSYSPVEVIDNVAQVAATTTHALILMSDGSLWAWGQNDRGQLGVPAITYSNRQIKIYEP